MAALTRLGLLDTPPEERFDRLTRLASTIMGTPIALLTLLDEERQWFKSRIGLVAPETPRTQAFCAHVVAIDSDDVFVIPDALEDIRFVDNPLVTGDPNIRFYAGRVVRDPSGLPIGTLCAIDRQPRTISDEQRQALIDLATLAEQQIARTDREQSLVELAESELGKTQILNTVTEGLVLQDANGRIIEWNPAAERLLGITGDQLAGRTSADPLWRAIHPDGSPWTTADHPVVNVRRTNRAVDETIMGVHRPDGSLIWLAVNARPVLDQDGSLTGVVAAFADVTAARRSQMLLDATMDTAPVGLAVLDHAKQILRCNPSFAKQVGREPDDLIGVDVRDIVSADENAPWTKYLPPINQPSNRRHHRVVRPDGSEIWINSQIAVVGDLDESIGILATFDITAERKMVRDLTRFSYLFLHANDIILVVDSNANLLYSSPSTGRLLGYPVGWSDPAGILGLVHPDDLARSTAELAALVDNTRGEEPFCLRVRAHNGEWRHLECVGANLLDEPTVGGVVITARDITERQRLAEELSYRASHDELTDLATRRLLEERLDESLTRSRRDGRRVAVCFLDLDGFKGVNDRLGHAAGDHLLVSVAERIRQVVRAGDTAARMGGDEFVVVLDLVGGADEARIAASRIRDHVAELAGDLPPDLPFGVSIGVAWSELDDTPSSLLNRADAALYVAKSHRNSSIEFDRQLTVEPVPASSR